MIKIALIEVTDFHDECLFSHIQYLKGPNHHITLICNQKLEARVKDYPDVDEFIFVNLDTKWKKYKAWFDIWRLLKGKMSKIIFNTGESYINKLLFFPFKNTELIGVLHNAQKLKRKKQIAISNKLDKYFVLGDFIKQSVERDKLSQLPIGVFYPIVFPAFKIQFHKPKNETWITIPGAIEMDKRDYQSLLALKMPESLKLILLGRPKTESSKEFIQQLLKSNIAENVIVFDSFISYEIFHTYIKQSDFILPLIHPNNTQFFNYLSYKITGSYNLAIAYNIPMLLEQSFNAIDEYKNCALYYDYKAMATLPDIIKEKKEYYSSKHWDVEVQKRTYTNFVFSKQSISRPIETHLPSQNKML